MRLKAGIADNVTAYVVPNDVDALAAFAMASYAARRGLLEGDAVLDYLRTAFEPPSTDSDTVHNLVTTNGLAALAYNATAAGDSDGDVLAHFAIGDDTTPPKESDIAPGNQLSLRGDLWQVVTRNFHIAGYHLTGDERDTLIGEDLNEIAVKTNNSGSGKASDNITFARAVLFAGDRYTVTADMSIIFVWTFAYRWVTERDVSVYTDDGRAGKDFGLHFFATRMYDLSLYDGLAYVAVGDGSSNATPWVDQLGGETGRVAVTYNASGAQITGTTSLSIGEVGGTISEVGPAVGATADQQVVFVGENQDDPPDNDSVGVTISVIILFFNVFEPVGYDTEVDTSVDQITIGRDASNGLLNLREGDHMLLFVAHSDPGATITSPGSAGWTTLWAHEAGPGNLRYAAFHYVLQNDTPVDLQFDSDTTGTMRATAIAFRHIDGHGETTRSEGVGTTTQGVPSVELADPGVQVFCTFQRLSSTFTEPDGWNVLENSSTDISTMLGWRPMPLGSTGSDGITGTQTTVRVCFSTSLNRVDLSTL